MITKEEVVADIEKIVAAKGADYVYIDDPKTLQTARMDNSLDELDTDMPPCYYKHYDGTPGCIVGQYIALKAPNVSVTEGSNASAAARQAGLSLNYDAELFLNSLQGHQDAGLSWGAALNGARGFSAKD